MPDNDAMVTEDEIVKGVIDKKRKVTTMTLDKLELLLKAH